MMEYTKKIDAAGLPPHVAELLSKSYEERALEPDIDDFVKARDELENANEEPIKENNMDQDIE